MESSIILTNEQIVHKIQRIAYQILESNSNENEIVIAGINGNGFVIANKIAKVLENISDVKVLLCEVKIDKKHPLEAIDTSLTKEEYQNKALVLVDDVLNSGTTLMYSVKHFLDVPLKKFKTAVLVNRNHKKYPVKADFKGISLSTSFHERVDVIVEGEEIKAYLK
ncbi:phosphoribosyltransferase family protein [Aureivirga sp. CE67]|uniref:phosphoribosyltransferase family protein n=1 Tax=Aureivirga sp. CE67 TaxID=1788983 RepID=UPI0018CB5E5E|nr:phosphoribosyltransferase family protein [Aureivirga sp. CE67]